MIHMILVLQTRRLTFDCNMASRPCSRLAADAMTVNAVLGDSAAVASTPWALGMAQSHGRAYTFGERFKWRSRLPSLKPPSQPFHRLLPLRQSDSSSDLESVLHQSFRQLAHASLPQSFFFSCLKSLASLFFRPHFVFILSNSRSLSSAISGAEQHRLTKNCEQSNLSASRTRVHVLGSSFRNLRISSMSSCERWYFFSYSGLTDFSWDAGGVLDARSFAIDAKMLCGFDGSSAGDAAAVYSALRGSDLGRNFAGVWYTFGALDGGLKMMWSCVSVCDGANEGSAFTRSAFRVRREDAALRRQVRHTNAAVSDEKREGLSCRGKNVVAIAVVA